MNSQFANLQSLSTNALAEQKKYWGDVRDSAEKGTSAYTEAIDKLKQIQSLSDARMKSQSKETLTTNLNNAGTADIKQSVEWLTKYQSTLEPLGREWRDINALIEAGNNRLKQLSDDVKMEAMADQFSRLSKLSEAALAGQKKYWEDVFRNAEKGTANYITAEGKLQQIKNLEQNRLRTEATATINNALSGNFNKTNEETREAIKLIEEYKKQLAAGNVDAIKEADKAITELNHKLDQAKKSAALDVLDDKDNHSAEQIKQAVDWLTKYRSTLATSTKEWKDLGVEIEKANEYMRSAEGADKMTIMEQKLISIGTVSASALSELKKYWQEVVDSTDKNNTNLAQYEDNLRRVIEEEKSRKAVSADAVMANLGGSSVVQIREAIKATEELRDSLKRSDPDWSKYNNQILNANDYLQKFETRAKKTEALSIASNTSIASVREMKQTIDFLTKYRDTLSTLDPEYDTITQALEDTTEALKKFNDSAKMDAMNKQMQNLNNLSKAALAEQKKYWQGVYDSAEKTSQAYKDAESNLMKLDQLERSRISADATQNITEALSGNWNKTIKETEEAIKLIQEYKNQLRTQSDTVLIDQANEAIEALNRNLGKAKEALMDVSEAKRIAEKVDVGLFDGTADDIDKARKSLEAYRKTLRMSRDAVEIEKVDKALSALAASAEQGGKNLKSLDRILADLKHASMDDLQSAAKRLQEELKGATRSTEEYAKTSLKLQRVNKELERAKKEWEGQESLFIRMTKRLSVYMAAYGSLSAITSYVKDLGHANLQLSDSIADVAKTTGLNAKELAKLGEDIRAIDTRTAQEQLYELAAAAGQLGIKSEAEVAGFVRAANMITVSLNELGTEATTQLMKIATLTGESQDGTEKALLSIGSAINELTASSAAAAGPIVDLMNRMGGIAAQSKITSAQMAAIGATADALGQSVEITGTSMNKFLATLMSNTDQIAYALNMDAKALRSFINEGKTMDAVIAIFERMNDMGGLGALAPVMGDLGSEGARMTQVLAAMAGKVDFLKGQLEISTEAYEKATSIQNEYNIKNENAIAILQRMGNAIKEIAVNNVAVDVITSLLRAMYSFFSYLQEGTFFAKALASSLMALTAALISTRIQWVKTVNEMSRVEVFRALLLWLKNLVTGTTAVTLSWERLGKALKANWFSLVIGAVAGLVTWMIKAATYVSEAAKATAKYNRELQEETDKVDTLFNSLKRLNSTEADRARTINAINSQYGQYLGFMLDEKDSAEKLAAAHQLINAELRKRMALNLRTALEGTANNEYAEQLEKSSAGIGKAVENLKVKIDGKDQKERSVTTSEVMRLVTKTINERVAKDASVSKEQLLSEIKTAMSDAYRRTDVSNTGKQYTVEVGADLFEDIEDHIGDLIDSRVKFQKKVALAEDQANVELEQLTKDALEARKAFLKQTESEINEAKNQTANLEKELEAAKTAAAKYNKKDESEEAVTARQNYELKEKELRDHYEKMVDNANDYVEATQKLKEDYNESLTEEDKKRMDEEIKMYQDFARETAKLAPGMDPWDKGRDVKDWREFSEIVTNLDTSSAKALAAAFKKIKDEAALFPDDVQKVYELFQAQGVDEISLEKLGLKDATSVADMVWKWEKQIKDKLETKFHRNTELGFIFKDDSGDMKTKVRQDYQAAMAALEAFYKEYEDFVRQKRADGLITEEAMNRQLLDNTRKYNEDKQQLIKKFLGEENTFNQKQYKGILSGYDYFSDKDLDKMAEQYQRWGDAMTDGGRNQIAKAGVEVSKAINKEQEKIKAELLKGDMFATFENNFAEMLDELGALTSAKEDEINNTMNDLARKSGSENIWGLSDEERKQRIAVLTKFADQSYQMNADRLKSEMLLETNNAMWVQRMNDEEMQLLLEKLRNYYDDRLGITKKYQDQLAKEFESYYKQSGKQANLDERMQKQSDKEERTGILEGAGVETDYGAKRKNITDKAALEGEKVAESIEMYKERLKTMKEGSQEYLATQGLKADQELKLNEILAQSQRDLTQVYMDEWTKRAERWGQWGEMFGEYLGEQVMLEKQANDARARGDLETAKKIEQQQKQNKQALIQNLLSKIVDEAALWAKEYALKMMFNSLMLAEEKKKAIEEVTLQGKQSMLSIFLSALTGQAAEAKIGLPGLITGAIVFAATMALQAMAKSAISNMFPEAETGSTGTRKLSTGMLTYAEGNYPVLGNDGKVYDAKYEGAGMKTGVYGGGAHFGIFSEKQPEMIVDGKTTQKIILNYPYIYDAITTIAKNGRLKNAMPTFATGDYPAGMKQLAPIAEVDASTGSNEQMERMSAALEQTQAVNNQLLKLLQNGISAHLDGLETHKQQKKNERFLKRRGID